MAIWHFGHVFAQKDHYLANTGGYKEINGLLWGALRKNMAQCVINARVDFWSQSALTHTHTETPGISEAMLYHSNGHRALSGH